MSVERLARVRAAMNAHGVDVLLLSVGADLPWLVGYEAMPLERLTMLVLPADDEATLVVPELEAPRVVEHPHVAVVGWGETEDPLELVAARVGPASTVAIGDRTWSRFVLALQRLLPNVAFVDASSLLGPLRAVKDAAEVEALARAGAAADQVVEAIQRGEVPLAGRTEAEVAAEVSQGLLRAGHQRVNFAIVATGLNAASPHHEPGPAVISEGDVVLFDIGGRLAGSGYCSDISRCVAVGAPALELIEAWEVLREAQEAAVAAATVGTPAEAVDAAARGVLRAAGHGEHFIHRTGHGIGVEEHEQPYLVAGNEEPLVAGNVFSIEPGIYVSGQFGLRLEDIVVATEDGPQRLNAAPRHLAIVEP